MQNQIVTIPATVVAKPILRVAAYCRVSSDSDDQLHSFAAQVQYYTRFISASEQMELEDIYADEGITGTKTAKRDDFNRLVADCIRRGVYQEHGTACVEDYIANSTAAKLSFCNSPFPFLQGSNFNIGT